MRSQTITAAVLGMTMWVAGPVIEAIAADTSPSEKGMILIHQGGFTMGAFAHGDEMKHEVFLDTYLIDKFETSNARYRAFMQATRHPAPAYWDDPRLNQPNQPVVGVSWTDANAFCKWEGKRLPTEAEWERAATGPEGNKPYPWGNALDPRKANYAMTNDRTMPVDSYPEGVSGFGVYNMAGNVFEWVADWYEPNYYKESPKHNPQGPDQGHDFSNQGQVRVLRGGSWLAPASSLHASHRFWNRQENNSYGVGLGFRCAKSVDQGSLEGMQEGREAFIQALVAMGAEKNADALILIEKALSTDHDNKEYLATRDLIKKSMKKK